MISIIVCSINKILLAQLKTSIIETIGVIYEIVVIDNSDNSYSLPQAYNIGAAQAKYPYLCFVHEDILFHTQDWGQIIIRHLSAGDVSMAGVLGCLIKTQIPSGVYIPIKHLNRINQLQRRPDGGVDHYYENPDNEYSSQVVTVDGMFLTTTKSNHQKYPFDEKYLKGFHAYDVDYSLGQAANGKIVVIYDVLIEHFSYGGNTRQWIDAQLSLIQKWKAQLPRYFSLNEREIKKAEIINTETFLMALYTNRYKKSLQFEYLIRLLLLRPLSFENLYFIRKFLLGGDIENFIKRTLRR